MALQVAAQNTVVKYSSSRFSLAMTSFSLRPHPHLYQINTYVWLESLSSKLGRTILLADVPDAEWDAIAAMGFDIVWLMGVWRRSAISAKLDLENRCVYPAYTEALPGWIPADIIGSPYAVASYEPDPRIGSWNDIDDVRRKLHDRRMGLFFDFVGNHTALDHPWTSEHPEFYVQGSKNNCDPASFYKLDIPRGTVYLALGKDPYFPAWKDVAQLNHFSPEMRAAQLAELKKIAGHCDGVRCDMAMLQLNEIFEKIWRPSIGSTRVPATEFWADARKAAPELTLLAEAYWGTEQRLIDLGFSFVYDKSLYDAVHDGCIGNVHARLSAPVDSQSHFARFLENHDEPRFAAAFDKQRSQAVATIMGTLPGLRFYQQGEERGVKLRTPLGLRAIAEQPTDPELKSLFAKLFAETRNDAFHEGQWKLLTIASDNDGTGGNLVAYQWRSPADRVPKVWKVIVANLSGAPAQGRLQFAGQIAPGSDYVFVDALDGARYVRKGDELAQLGLFVRRDAYQAHLFDVGRPQ